MRECLTKHIKLDGEVSWFNECARYTSTFIAKVDDYIPSGHEIYIQPVNFMKF